MKVAAIQHDIMWEEPEANHERIAPMIAAAVAAGARLIALTEMFATGFSMNTKRTAEPLGGANATFLETQAKEHAVWVCGSVAVIEDEGELPYNTLIVAGPDGDTQRYRKIHPFTYGGERNHFRAGSEHVTLDIEGVRTALFVCYDLRFADEFWTIAPDTDLYIVVANWPEPRREHWTTLLRARAIENQAYVLGCNRVGEGGSLTYTGDSRIIDPMGEELAAGAQGETLLLADVDVDRVRETRERFPFMQDRR